MIVIADFNPRDWARVVSDDEAEQADFVVCMRDVPGTPRAPLAAHFGHCSRCFHAVYWADSAPKRPPRVCVECALELAKTQHDA